ncbi:MAG: YtxH domain-containing protein [Endomicrobium sp.]|jgi:gas vesicle protein|nr:YtxH domain-containing protein [Endomicrobium sp.]
MCDKKDSLAAFILGGIIGVAIGILYAPRSGRETRYNLRRVGEDIADTVSDLSEDMKETGRKLYNEGREKVMTGKDKISEAFEAGKKAFEKYKKED